MKKRVLSILLAVVIFTTAIVVLPNNNIVQGESTNTSTGNTTWDGSVHALEEGAYTSKTMYGLLQSQNDYGYPDTFHISTFNSCDYYKDPKTGKYLYSEDGDSGCSLGDCDVTPDAIKNLPTYDGANGDDSDPNNNRNGYGYSYYAKVNAGRTENYNIRTRIYNFDGLDITDYRYLRFQIHADNCSFNDTATGDSTPYFKVQLYTSTDTSSSTNAVAEYDYTSTFRNNTTYDYIVDVTNVNQKIVRIEFHFKTLKQTNTSLASTIWYDNIRFLKNATHTKSFASDVTEKVGQFSSCSDKSKNILYDWLTPDVPFHSGISSSHYEGESCFYALPDRTTAQTKLIQGVFVKESSEEFKLSDYDYFRFNIHFASALENNSQIQFNEYSGTDDETTKKKWPQGFENTNSDYPFTIYFSHYENYIDNVNTPNSIGMIRGNLNITKIKENPGAGWWVCVADLSKVTEYTLDGEFDPDKPIKSISIQLGQLNFPTTSYEGDKAIHIDNLQFVKYTYSDSKTYTYPAGHYQVLHNFEGSAQAVHNTANNNSTEDMQRRVMRGVDLKSAVEYNSEGGSWLTRAEADGENYKNVNTGSIGAKRRDEVTQGMYASWLRAKSGDYGSTEGALQAAYNFEQSRDLSKFTHFSIDLTIRPQNETTGHKIAPGLTGSDEKFRLRLRSNQDNNAHFDIEFTLKRKDGTSGFYTSDDGVEILPLEGFIPGYKGAYTASGCMRITFTLDALLKNAVGNFDITSVDQIRFFMLRNTEGRTSSMYTTDAVDIFLDNLVAFTPDMKITVKTEGVPDSDYTQPFVFTIVGDDKITNHVNASFTLQGNDSEVIYNLPFNSYTIYQTDWAWRYKTTADTMKHTVAQEMSTLDKPNVGSFTYKDMMENRIPLFYEVTFNPTKTNEKWLSDTQRVQTKSRN